MQDLGYVTPLLSSFCHPYEYHRLSRTGMELWTSHVNLQTPREMCILYNK